MVIKRISQCWGMWEQEGDIELLQGPGTQEPAMVTGGRWPVTRLPLHHVIVGRMSASYSMSRAAFINFVNSYMHAGHAGVITR